jgi:hypothetical protein
MKLPKGFGKWNSEQQRSWIKVELQKAEIRAEKLRKLSREAQRVIIQVDVEDRPDLIEMKS